MRAVGRLDGDHETLVLWGVRPSRAGLVPEGQALEVLVGHIGVLGVLGVREYLLFLFLQFCDVFINFSLN